MLFDLPVPVLLAIMRLNAMGYEAYTVGGCVRDMLQGVQPHDYDICVSCTPEQTHACFHDERVIDTGIRHGTVTVLLGGMPLEITTFRTDGKYLDGRHPDTVHFTRSLREDLQRRDFTVNAMAYHPEEGITDLFGGREDLKNRLIRCVGSASERLEEDALRIMRAIRFAAQLDFDIEENTASALHMLRKRLKLVSRERIAEELRKTAAFPAAAEKLSEFPDILFSALPDYAPDALHPGLTALACLPGGDSVCGMAAILYRCDEASLRKCLDSLHLSNAFRDAVFQLARNAGHAFPAEDTAVMLAGMGEEQLKRLLTLQQACGTLSPQEAARRSARMRSALAAGIPLSLQGLPLRGDDLQRMGYHGEQLGDKLRELHLMVLRGQLPCDRAALLSWLTERH